MGKPKELKTKEERVKEGVSLLTQLRTAYVKEHIYGYQELKRKISEWVNTGEAWEGTIPFPEHGREAVVDLPKYNNKAAGIHFNVKAPY
jgi:hypothetical protein